MVCVRSRTASGIVSVMVACTLGCGDPVEQQRQAPAETAPSAGGAPVYRVDPFWPQELPNNWILGQVASIAVGPDDHIWIVHRQFTLTGR